MPISRMKLTPDGATSNSACYGCQQHSATCHGPCEDYAAEVILAVIGSAEHSRNQQHTADMYHVERDRVRRGLR